MVMIMIKTLCLLVPSADKLCKQFGPRSGSTSLVMPIGDPRDGFFYPTLTLVMGSY